jgi:hypothetical protein
MCSALDKSTRLLRCACHSSVGPHRQFEHRHLHWLRLLPCRAVRSAGCGVLSTECNALGTECLVLGAKCQARHARCKVAALMSLLITNAFMFLPICHAVSSGTNLNSGRPIVACARYEPHSCAPQPDHFLMWGSEGDADLHAEYRGVGDVTRAAGLLHVLNVRLNIGELRELDAITQLEYPFVVRSAFAQ